MPRAWPELDWPELDWPDLYWPELDWPEPLARVAEVAVPCCCRPPHLLFLPAPLRSLATPLLAEALVAEAMSPGWDKKEVETK